MHMYMYKYIYIHVYVIQARVQMYMYMIVSPRYVELHTGAQTNVELHVHARCTYTRTIFRSQSSPCLRSASIIAYNCTWEHKLMLSYTLDAHTHEHISCIHSSPCLRSASIIAYNCTYGSTIELHARCTYT